MKNAAGPIGNQRQPGERASPLPENEPTLSPKAGTWRGQVLSLHIRTVLVYIAVDLFSIFAGLGFAAGLRGAVGNTNWFLVASLLAPLFVAVAANGDGYNLSVVRDPFRAVSRGVKAFAIALAVLLLAAYYLKASASLPRLTIAMGACGAIMLMSLLRYHLARHLDLIIGGNPYSVALIWEPGQPMPATQFSITITADSLMNPDLHDPLMYDRLAKSLTGVSNVVVACHPDRRAAWTHMLKGANIQSEILMPELDVLAPLGINRHGGTMALVVAHGPLNLADRVIKRLFDVAVAGLALLALSPFMLVTAICIKLESPGPVFFRQTRIGRGNEIFRIFKFRSMRVTEQDVLGARSASRDDDRITRIGRFIRATSVDELPQLLNVLEGSMSIVGPRPHALGSRAANKLFWEVDSRYWHRHAAKPGLTGLAQIRGYRGATFEEVDLQNRLQADLEYLDTWSIWRDLKIIFLTFQVLIHRNAF